MKSRHTIFAVVVLLVTGLYLITQPVAAHHSGAAFDRSQVLEFRGTIKEFQFTNPHTWVQIYVEQEDGETVEWSFEWGSPNQLGRRGIRPSSFPVGAQVLVRTNPMHDGSPAGSFVGAKFEDGMVIGRWDD